MPRVLAGVVALGLFVYAFTDCIQAQSTAYLTKGIWLVVITLVPILGPLLWLLFGRGGGWWGRDDDPGDPIGDPSMWRDFERQF
jgi:drug/metabolite transporter (DMT)-like permease